MNFMGPKSSVAFANMLEINMSLKTLNLQGNQLKDTDAVYLGNSLKNNMSLVSLDISHNQIGNLGAEAIAEGLTENFGLSDFDISWNCIRDQGIAAIGRSLMINRNIEIIDLSWNSFGPSSATVFKKTLHVNTRLKVLDLSYCRVGINEIIQISSGIIVNKGLESFLINGNPLTNRGVDSLINSIIKNKTVQTLSLDDIYLNKQHVKKLENLEAGRIGFTAMHSGVNGLLKKRQLTSVLILFDRFLEDHRETMIDLFHSLDSDGSGDVTLDELKLGFKEHGLRLTNKLIDMLLEEIDTDKSGTIEFQELMNAVAVARHTAEKQMILSDPMKALQQIKIRRDREEAEKHAQQEAERLRLLQEREAFEEFIKDILINSFVEHLETKVSSNLFSNFDNFL